ncbi:MAG: homocysteine S-methyltransferase family protein [Coriobacteriaceae bacterium]
MGELAPHDRALVMAQPNAGLPRIQDGETVFDVGPNEFAQAMEAIMDAGATVVGGCCGTTPDHIAALRALIDVRPLPAVASVSVPAHTSVASLRQLFRRLRFFPCCLGAKRAEGPLGVQRPQPALLSCLRGDPAADGVAARGRGAHRRHRRAHQPDGEEEAESGSASG